MIGYHPEAVFQGAALNTFHRESLMMRLICLGHTVKNL